MDRPPPLGFLPPLYIITILATTIDYKYLNINYIGIWCYLLIDFSVVQYFFFSMKFWDKCLMPHRVSRFSRKKIIRIGSILSVQEVTREIYKRYVPTRIGLRLRYEAVRNCSLSIRIFFLKILYHSV